jgi:hypothetical protein
MTPLAITMLVVAIACVWGGLVLALLNLRRHPEVDEEMPQDIAPEL